MQTTYVLKSRSGTPLLTFDNINRAKDVQRERKQRGVNLRLFVQRVTEEEVE